MKESELNALISLLDDSDSGIYNQIKDKILSIGDPIIPVLENAWEHSFNPLMQKRIEDIIHQIQFESLANDLTLWAKDENRQLLQGAVLVARYQYPDLEEDKLKKNIEQIRKDAWLEINESQTAPEKVKILNNVLFSVHGFAPNTANYQAPQNNYINHVLEQKKGNALSLSLIYLIIAESLDLPVSGVNLPDHFILAYRDESPLSRLFGVTDENNILFYINPFNRGAIFSKREIDVFLTQLKIEPKPEFYNPCSNIDIIKRLMVNLVNAYQQTGLPKKCDELKLLIDILNGKESNN